MDAAALLAMVRGALGDPAPARLGVAVSGGSDSVALLCLLAQLQRAARTTLSVISVDHGLRHAARAELETVRALCTDLGIEQHIEYWTGWDGGGNMQAAARTARYDLIADWAVGNDIDVVAVGHTANDQAETVLMRLARGSGVDGLSAMAERRRHNGIDWLRPLLGAQRRDLRAYLTARGTPWVEDPSNEDADFERVRVRSALQLLEPLGLDAQALGQVARNMGQARDALNLAAWQAAREVAVVDLGAVRLDLGRWQGLPAEIARRLLVHSVRWISGAVYPPRRASIDQLMAALTGGRAATLAGVQLEHLGDEAWLFREYAAVEAASGTVEDLWDDRWSLEGEADTDALSVRAIGPDGLAQIEGWRDLGLPRAALLSLPGVWEGPVLRGAPVQGGPDEWQIEIADGDASYYDTLLSH
ncbi:MAG: tRNA lysidine(34) synthetase TilS [Pseudomonadota bacterium]